MATTHVCIQGCFDRTKNIKNYKCKHNQMVHHCRNDECAAISRGIMAFNISRLLEQSIVTVVATDKNDPFFNLE